MSAVPIIHSGPMRVEVDSAAGGRIAQITVGETPLLVGCDDVGGDSVAWGAYPMVPWAGRIRDGRFTFEGETFQLPRNNGNHAMHGVGFTSPWDVTDLTPTQIEMRLQLPTDQSWPFGGAVTHRLEMFDGGFTAVMTVTADGRSIPASIGWHPWFRKPEWLQFSPTAMYRRDDDHIAVDELIEVPAGPWDDCFVNTEPVEFQIGDVHVTMRSDCTDWVVFDERSHATCIEPQTGPPDAFNIRPVVLEPGDELSASFQLSATVRPPTREEL